ncbi:MAG: cysteine desulfurase [Gammaproteobacteria bacterium]|nr:cysteine desulfurase [Gammaproteobacteria bacterium]
MNTQVSKAMRPESRTGVAKNNGAKGYDVYRIREDFPILAELSYGKPLTYLDNAATSQKPRQVLEAMDYAYRHTYANVHRGVHDLSERATRAYEDARGRVQRFIGASDAREIVFVRGTTEAINLVAATYGRANIREGDEILITEMEHHSNIVPWQLLREQTGAKLRVVPINDAGELVMEEFEKLLSERTRLVTMVHISNALGTINPVRRMIELAHDAGAKVLIDGAQAVPHMRVDVQNLGCDFYAFSSHKLYGPSGIGVLYGRYDLLDAMPPYQGGGEMIRRVTFERSDFAKPPTRFEAGTPNIVAPVGLAAAIDYVDNLGLENIAVHEDNLLRYATGIAADTEGMRLIGTAAEKASILSFELQGVHPHDIGTIVDHEGVALRAGHHCAMPVMDHFKVPATTRASFGLYNTREEVDALFASLAKVREVLG